MKFKLRIFSFNEFFKHNKIISKITILVFSLFFLVIRKVNSLFSLNEGNVVVIALHRLGDTIFSVPAVKQIVEHYGSKTVVLCFSASVPIYKRAFTDIEFCTIERSDFYFQERIAKFTIRQKLRALKPYIIFDITGTMMSASLIFNIRARKIIGVNGKLYSMIYDQFVLYRENPKLVDIYLDAISPVFQIQDRNQLKEQVLAANPNGKILVHPFARLKEKEWGLRKFTNLAKKLHVNYDVSIIMQTNYINYDIVQEIINSDVNLVQTNSSEELIQRITECSLFIGNDSGPVNIANFIGKPTFTIYGSTNPVYTAPTSYHQIFIQKILKCSARQNEKLCFTGGEIYICPGIQCMNLLTIEEVYKDIIPLVNKYCNRRALN